jgi:hypothetical protein
VAPRGDRRRRRSAVLREERVTDLVCPRRAGSDTRKCLWIGYLSDLSDLSDLIIRIYTHNGLSWPLPRDTPRLRISNFTEMGQSGQAG